MSHTAAQQSEGFITAAQLLAMGEVGPCELIDGRIVPMTPTGGLHGIVEVNLVRHLGNFVSEHKLGWLLSGEVGIITRRDPDRVRGADVAFLPRHQLPDGPPTGFVETAPDLIAEIVSPNDRWQDIREKLEEYFSLGVPLVWLVEPKRQAVLVFRSIIEMEQLSRGDMITGEGALQGFKLAVEDLFPE